MELIIQQIVSELVSKILEQAYSGGINDIDALATSVLEDCKNSASQMIEAIHAELNITIRKDKAGRKEPGLVLKEKERPRELYTELVTIVSDTFKSAETTAKWEMELSDIASGKSSKEEFLKGIEMEIKEAILKYRSK